MSVWLQGMETRCYRVIAHMAAKYLGRCDPVLSVYTRRSVACGEVVLGGSDIDLQILIEPLPDVYAEAQFLSKVSARYAVLKRIFPYLGECEVSTEAELESWYRSRPYTWYRDRGWLKLYGKEYQRPLIAITDGEARDSLLWWFFWAWERLPGFYRAGNIRTCCNLFLDMVNAYGLYLGALHTPLRRSELLRYWRTLTSPSREQAELWSGFHNGFRGPYGKLLPWLYSESLRLCDALYPHAAYKLDGAGCSAELRSRPPFRFSRRTYLLLDPLHATDVSQALACTEKNPEVVVATEKTLKLYFYHRNPWEYYTVHASDRSGPFTPPYSRSVAAGGAVRATQRGSAEGRIFRWQESGSEQSNRSQICAVQIVCRLWSC